MSTIHIHSRALAVAVFAIAACRPSSSTASSTQYSAAVAGYDPSRALGPLFHDVQMASVFPDSKTFADARPLDDPGAIVERYAKAKDSAGFDLKAFVTREFEIPGAYGAGARTDTTQTMEQHIVALWPVLTRHPDSTNTARSSLIPLPNPYVVPGGRFREVYYWDSYFTMEGLVASGRTDLVKDMLDNFAHLVRTVGHIPNGNRTYYLSRSQPPFLAAMVGLYATATDTAKALVYLDALEKEHDFWMDGADQLQPGQALRRVVRLPEGTVLNRYWDDRDDPRPESYREDYSLAQTLPDSARSRFYRNVRATAESGWDFSSRWMRDPKDLRSLETTEIIPVDLNSLMYNQERTIAALLAYRNHAGDREAAARFARIAEARRQALLTYAYDDASYFFYDVRWRDWQRLVTRPTLAAASVLYFGLATPAQGNHVALRLERDFLKPGGFATTLVPTGQQWDAPNGWAPLEWLAIEGVRRYRASALADTAADRWLALNRRIYRATGKMTEKYDVLDITRAGGGGEYPNQDGFGWTNGVALALSAQLAKTPAPAPAHRP
ncbi:MAG: alpha,alpha-trehalase TreF [Gemmatimonadaceae bacterium]|nr:alpha,alpha-trehalase TreF [Gemmatimonadaceae bacterium]